MCSAEQFKCKDGLCIANNWKCDDTIDCLDGSDEDNCTAPPRKLFLLPFNVPALIPRSQTISADSRIADPEPRPDNLCSDLGNCSFSDNLEDNLLALTGPSEEIVLMYGKNCFGPKFICLSGLCIDLNKQCNGVYDCQADDSDETNCSLAMYSVTSRQPDLSWKDDSSSLVTWSSTSRYLDTTYTVLTTTPGSSLATNSSTEAELMNKSTTLTLPLYETPLPTMSSPAIYNATGSVSMHGVTTLAQEQDSCTGPRFICHNKKCFPLTSHCNGIRDCEDGFDELNCTSIHVFNTEKVSFKQSFCSINQLSCNDGTCIEKYRKCDGILDCKSGVDEENCTIKTNILSPAGNITAVMVPVQQTGSFQSSVPAIFSNSSDSFQSKSSTSTTTTEHLKSKKLFPKSSTIFLNSSDNTVLKLSNFPMPKEANKSQSSLDSLHLNLTEQYNLSEFSNPKMYEGAAQNFSNLQISHRPIESDILERSGKLFTLATLAPLFTTTSSSGANIDNQFQAACDGNQFPCLDGSCLVKDVLCNGTIECEDGTDEQYCPLLSGSIEEDSSGQGTSMFCLVCSILLVNVL
jgi:hypothetical protein